MFVAKICRSLPRQGWNALAGQRLTSTSSSSSTAPEPAERRSEKSINQVTLLGRVGNEPQLRGTEENPVVIFSVATHNNYQSPDNHFQKTDWHRICVFRPYLRDTVYRYMTKGQRVLVQGRITYAEIKDASGNPHTSTSIIADDVTFFSGKNDGVETK